MATEKQITANRRNAQHSTGPRTPQGKAASARNAVTGRFSRHLVLTGVEDQAEFQALLDGPLERRPAAIQRRILVTGCARQLWLSQRIARMQFSLGPLPPSPAPGNAAATKSRHRTHFWQRTRAAGH